MAGDPGSDDTVPPDSFDAILKRVVRAPAAGAGPRELAVGEVIGGRFTIERALGAGGMGTVYAATDQTLGRTVAIKVHHAAGGGVRLRREAIAMARLAHPNVVTVFEVGELEHRPFVVMEYVTGTTLREWLAATPRAPDAILDVMIAAGEGLAAAHAAGLIHRDIKPENVLIGSDGRTRVGDFGLARDRDSKDDPPPASATDRLLSPMTQTGAVLGTPAYMAPEQVAGRTVDARTDQFAFCVTAWEALWGERPFAGSTFEELLLALTSGTRRAPPPLPKVAAHVRAALERGLARDPDARFPTMQALLVALRPPAPRRRRRWILGGVALGTALGGGVIALAITARSPSVAPGFSPLLATKRDACIAVEQRTLALKRAAIARPSDRHRLETCSDPAYLAASPAIPSDPQKLAAFIAARAELRVVYATLDTVPRATIEATLAHLSASAAADDPEMVAAILAIHARTLAFDGKLAESDKLYADAYYAARALDDADDSLTALVGLIDNATRLRVDHAAADQWLRMGLADAERLRTRSPWFAVRMYLEDAQLADQEEDAKRALDDLARARKLLDADDPDRVRALEIEGDVLMWSGKVDAGIAAFEESLALEARLDPTPLHQALGLANYAAALLAAERTTKALEVAEHAMQLIAAAPDGGGEVADNARVDLAAVLLSASRDDEAQPLLEIARKNTVARYGERNAIVANIDANLALIDGDRGDYAHALARLKAVLAIEEAQLGPDQLVVANRLYSIAATLGKLERPVEALVAARRALAIFAAKSSGSPQHQTAKLLVASFARATGDPTGALALTDEVIAAVHDTDEDARQTIAWANLERGHALLDLGRKVEARAAFAVARPLYDKLDMKPRVAELDGLDRRAR